MKASGTSCETLQQLCTWINNKSIDGGRCFRTGMISLLTFTNLWAMKSFSDFLWDFTAATQVNAEQITGYCWALSFPQSKIPVSHSTVA